jgi:hypothetical protein
MANTKDGNCVIDLRIFLSHWDQVWRPLADRNWCNI